MAGSANCPTQLLAALAKDMEYVVRKGVAGNVDCPTKVLAALATDMNRDVRSGVAGNVNSPTKVLAVPATDKNKDVREYVAQNVNCPVELLLALATDKNKDVRGDVARKVNCPIAVLVVVVEASPDDVLVASDPDTGEYLLALLVKSKNGKVRAPLARCRYEPALPVLAQDKVLTVRVAVAKQPQTPLDVLKVLAADADVEVRKAVLANPSATDEGGDRYPHGRCLVPS